MVAKRGQALSVPVEVRVSSGYHVTSAAPGDRYLKPLRLTWEKGVLLPGTAIYPEPTFIDNAETKTKLSVYEGTFTIKQPITVPSDAPQGFGALVGKLSFQACTDTECYPPATIPVRLSYDIR